MASKPTRAELRMACRDAEDFMVANLDGASADVLESYAKTIRVLDQFAQYGKLKRPRKEQSNG